MTKINRGSGTSTVKRITGLVGILAVLAMFGASVLGTSPASAAASEQQTAASQGSLLGGETFMGATLSDSRWVGSDDSCLSAATDDDSSASNIGKCSKDSGTRGNVAGKTNGYLQLTDNSYYTKGSVIYNRALPSTSGLDITFETYMYSDAASSDAEEANCGGTVGGTVCSPADGIGFFMADGAYNLEGAAQDGGALGYAAYPNRGTAGNNLPGLAHAQLGIGLDQFGNYGSTEVGGTDCDNTGVPTTMVPNTVSVRGPGDGMSGYCLIASKTLSGGVTSDDTFTTKEVPNNSPIGTLDPTANLVHIVISPYREGEHPQLTVSINGHVMIDTQLTFNLPKTVKYGFLASTGGGRSAHLVRNVVARTVEPLAAGTLMLTKTVNRDTSSADSTEQQVFTKGESVPYSYLVTNTGDSATDTAVGELTVSDPGVSGEVKCPETSLQPGDSMVCTATSTAVTSAEAGSGSLNTQARVTGNDESGNTVSANDDQPVPLYTQGEIVVNKVLKGSGAALVEANKEYTVHYSYPAGAYQYCSTGQADASVTDTTEKYAEGSGILTVKADGTAASTDPIPTGAVLSISEDKPADTESPAVKWLDPVISVTPATSGCQDSKAAVTVTNTAVGKVPLSYDGNGADSGAVGGVEDYSGTVVSIAANGFSREGYTFTGWNTKSDGTGTAYKAQDSFTLPDSATVLYAQWTSPSTPGEVVPGNPGESSTTTPTATLPSATSPSASVLGQTGAGLPVWGYAVAAGAAVLGAIAIVISRRHGNTR